MTLSVPVNRPAKRKLVAGLSTLRLVAALVVASSHLASNMRLGPESQAGFRAWQVLRCAANGSVAVAFFFVISGFCIHLGQANNPRFDARLFLVSRGIRIGIPLIAVGLLAQWMGATEVVALKSVLWSVYCELIYYAAYPALLLLRRRMSIRRILGYGVLIAIAYWFIGSHYFPGAFHGVPTVFAYCIPLFPLWLLGALLAERHGAQIAPATSQSIGCWRGGALMLCFIASFIQVNAWQLGSWLLYPIIGLFCCAYLPKELARWSSISPPLLMEKVGAASYTIYLVHIFPIAWANQHNPLWPFPWLVAAQVAAIAIVAVVFYLACELPSHKLAQFVSRLPRLERATVETTAY